MPHGSDEPARLIGTCATCGRWDLLDRIPGDREGPMLLLPDHADWLETLASDLKSRFQTDGAGGKSPPDREMEVGLLFIPVIDDSSGSGI